MNDLEKELNRLQDQQIENFQERRAGSVDKVHKRIEKLLKLKERESKK